MKKPKMDEVNGETNIDVQVKVNFTSFLDYFNNYLYKNECLYHYYYIIFTEGGRIDRN